MKNAKSKPLKKRIGYDWIVYLLAALCVSVFVDAAVWGWIYLKKPSEFPIKEIKVLGNPAYVDVSHVVDVTRKTMRGSFFSLTLNSVRHRLLENPWVAQVDFRRIWPSTLEITLQEQQVVARWGQQGLVNQEGDIFYPDVKTLNSQLPELDGPKDQALSMLQSMQRFNALLQPVRLSVQVLRLAPSGVCVITLNSGAAVNLGKEEWLSRLQRLVHVYAKLVERSPHLIVTIDCRYPNGFAVSYKSAQKLKEVSTRAD